MKLYTVDRHDTLVEGKILELTIEDPLSLTYYELPNVFNGDDLKSHLNQIFPEGLSIHGWNYLKRRHTFGTNPNFQHYTTYFTEMNLEYVRKGFFDDHPSRFQSIFACNSIEDAIKFR